MGYDTEVHLKKRDSGKFDYGDLHGFVQRKLPEGASVVVLPVGCWVKLANQWVLCKEVGGDIDDAFVRIVIRPLRPLFDWLLLPIAKVRETGVWIIWGSQIPNTNVFLDVWYAGDGSGGTALAAIES